MAYRIAINGFGRIGRSILRALCESTNYAGLHIVAINDVADIETLAHLTRYDSTHGRFLGTVAVERDSGDLLVNEDRIAISQTSNPGYLPWADLGVDLVMECSGAFSDRANAEQHLKSGAHRVLFSQPAESDVDATVVYGINHETLSASASIVSNASCTTNCIVPVLKVLDDSFGLQSGVITTIHSAMNDQPVIDGYHNSDLRRTRSAMQSIIPVNTELARGIERILPNLSGLLEAQAIRVPTVNVSAMDLTVTLAQTVTAEQVNKALREYSQQLPDNVLGVSDELLASCDYNHDPRSAVVDSNQTRVAPNNLVKLLVWFDNEWAYANRMLDVAQFMSEQ
ncbi:MAG TPA: type I glyceraldehyde-3-phosphate dehydrogenase [Gammaproteobacteria bacterium]|nr:type I glyceraldehyde-3-phosphate dehydrogenase [Gammaproteobacteria bacterium]OUX34701.1 MAG: type I glyceraldehyde-3-phosphate dehydrogenase [Gammaproteobacteria bacterium TMED260]HBP98855.1 type I glyceraldehyde-3-phosphate dehydrogenase [Gammaproteobacteria bacterium]HCA37750.1 type I glyceraldehyde-3-phosphate dehydrogenase [Gammaproteobacteria bacterium]